MNIDEICEYYGIKNYTINPDNTIDVDGNVYLSRIGLTKLPLKFNKVTGNFNCFWNNLTNLEGSPTYVGGWFDCSRNKLTTLEGSPNYINGSFICEYNNLTSLDGYPSIFGYLECRYNPLPQEIIDNPKAELTHLNREKKLNILLNEY
jgi:hypothetical protein